MIDLDSDSPSDRSLALNAIVMSTNPERDPELPVVSRKLADSNLNARMEMLEKLTARICSRRLPEKMDQMSTQLQEMEAVLHSLLDRIEHSEESAERFSKVWELLDRKSKAVVVDIHDLSNKVTAEREKRISENTENQERISRMEKLVAKSMGRQETSCQDLGVYDAQTDDSYKFQISAMRARMESLENLIDGHSLDQFAEVEEQIKMITQKHVQFREAQQKSQHCLECISAIVRDCEAQMACEKTTRETMQAEIENSAQSLRKDMQCMNKEMKDMAYCMKHDLETAIQRALSLTSNDASRSNSTAKEIDTAQQFKPYDTDQPRQDLAAAAAAPAQRRRMHTKPSRT